MVQHFLVLYKIFELKKILRNRREKIYRNMWYIIFKFRKYLNLRNIFINYFYM
jgi:hypothetical protein